MRQRDKENDEERGRGRDGGRQRGDNYRMMLQPVYSDLRLSQLGKQ